MPSGAPVRLVGRWTKQPDLHREELPMRYTPKQLAITVVALYLGLGTVLGSSPLPSVEGATTLKFGRGRHVITEPITLRSYQVLRGAGADHTTLYFPHGLEGMGVNCRNGSCEWRRGVITLSGTQVGLEGVTIAFPAHRWKHWAATTNGGYNGVSFDSCTHCWAEDVVVYNADLGIAVNGGHHNWVEDTAVHANPSGAHIHYSFTGGWNSTINNFQAHGDSVHGLAGNWGPQHVVFSNGWGESLRLEADHNGPATKNILYKNISGKIKSIQRRNRAGRPVDATFINIGGK
jgi:hypothetical protein